MKSDAFTRDVCGAYPEDAIESASQCSASSRKRPNLSTELVQFLRDRRICSHSQWNDISVDEKAKFLPLSNLTSLLNTTISCLAHDFRTRKLSVDTDCLPLDVRVKIGSGEIIPKIYTLLHVYQKWDDKRIRFFGKILMDIVNRKTGKKNCLWMQGKTNAGKSQLLESFIKGIAPGLYGIPLSTVRSTFMFGNCLSKRIIFWEEPTINDDNIEAVKNMFGGGSFSVDVKYKDNVIIDPTPCIVTANYSFRNRLVADVAETLGNRLFSFSMPYTVPDDCGLFPLSFEDWREFYFMLNGVGG